MAHKAVRSGKLRTDIKYNKRVPNSMGNEGKSYHDSFHKAEASKHNTMADAHKQQATASAASGDYRGAWHHTKIGKAHAKIAKMHEGMVGESSDVAE